MVSHNAGDDLAQCLDSLYDFISPQRIVVVDCAGTDGSTDGLENKGALLIRLNRNLGYTGGYNRALTEIRKMGGMFALIITPDATINAHDVAIMVELLEKEKSLGALFPLVRRADVPNKLEAAYGKINYRHRLVSMVKEEKLGNRKFNPFIEVDFGIGCCFIVRVGAFFEAGGFDEDFFAYHDEADLCEKLRKIHYRVAVMPTAFAVHKGIVGDFRRELFKEYMVTRNSVLFMKKHGGFFRWVKFMSFLSAAVFYYGAGAIFGNKRFSRRLLGYGDGFRNRPVRLDLLEGNERA